MHLKPWALGMALAVAMVPLPAAAWLGGDAASIETDQMRLNGALQTTAAVNYTVFEIQTPAGTLVREYLSPDKQVFAVAWEGPWLPDLRQLLGSYFAQYVEAASAEGGGSGPRVIQRPGLVVYAGGHMRAFSGKAFVPALVPKGVGLEEIR